MEFYMIRHGESEANAASKFSGWSPAALTEKGREQARRTGERLGEIHFDRIFSSDQLRATETAELVFPGREYTRDRRLREIHLGGILEDRRRTECFEEYGEMLGAAIANRDFTGFGGESFGMHRERVTQFAEDLAVFPDDAQIAAVCHGGTILAMLSYVLGAEIRPAAANIENASVTCFRREGGRWKLIKWSDTGRVICEDGPGDKAYAN